jgi:hypothetical protein
LNLLRAFRSQVLRRFEWGQRFINFYYKQGPYGAVWMLNHPWSRPIVRAALWPFWIFAWVSLNWGLTAALALSFALLMAPVLWLYKPRTKRGLA